MNNTALAINSSENVLAMVKKTMGMQTETAQNLILVIEHIEKAEERIDGKIEAVEDLIEEVKNTIVLSNGEAVMLQNAVNKKALSFTQAFFDEVKQEHDSNLFLSKLGQFRGVVYRLLKKRFNATRYTTILHVDFKMAMAFVDSLEYVQLTDTDKRWTVKQLEILDRLEVK